MGVCACARACVCLSLCECWGKLPDGSITSCSKPKKAEQMMLWLKQCFWGFALNESEVTESSNWNCLSNMGKGKDFSWIPSGIMDAEVWPVGGLNRLTRWHCFNSGSRVSFLPRHRQWQYRVSSHCLQWTGVGAFPSPATSPQQFMFCCPCVNNMPGK